MHAIKLQKICSWETWVLKDNDHKGGGGGAKKLKFKVLMFSYVFVLMFYFYFIYFIHFILLLLWDKPNSLHWTKLLFKWFGWFISKYINVCISKFQIHTALVISLFLLIFNVLFELKMKSLKVPKPNDPLHGCIKSRWIKYKPSGGQITLFHCVSLKCTTLALKHHCACQVSVLTLDGFHFKTLYPFGGAK